MIFNSTYDWMKTLGQVILENIKLSFPIYTEFIQLKRNEINLCMRYLYFFQKIAILHQINQTFHIWTPTRDLLLIA